MTSFYLNLGDITVKLDDEPSQDFDDLQYICYNHGNVDGRNNIILRLLKLQDSSTLSFETVVALGQGEFWFEEVPEGGIPLKQIYPSLNYYNDIFDYDDEPRNYFVPKADRHKIMRLCEQKRQEMKKTNAWLDNMSLPSYNSNDTEQKKLDEEMQKILAMHDYCSSHTGKKREGDLIDYKYGSRGDYYSDSDSDSMSVDNNETDNGKSVHTLSL